MEYVLFLKHDGSLLVSFGNTIVLYIGNIFIEQMMN